jgi:hypothetical protein
MEHGCHCLCGLNHALGLCAGEATVLVEMKPNPYARVVPMCGPCAEVYRRAR